MSPLLLMRAVALPMRRFVLLLAGVAAISEWRAIFRRESPRDREVQRLQDRIAAMWHIYVFFLLATIPILLVNVTAVPGSQTRDTF